MSHLSGDDAAFLKQQDERQWFSGHVRRYVMATNGSQRGIVPTSEYTTPEQAFKDLIKDHLPCHTVIERQKARRQQVMEGQQRTRESVVEAKALYAELDAIEGERDMQEYRVPEQDLYYAPTSACPNERCEERGDECTVCQGTKRVSHTLGLDSEADWPPPGWLRTRGQDPQRSL